MKNAAIGFAFSATHAMSDLVRQLFQLAVDVVLGGGDAGHALSGPVAVVEAHVEAGHHIPDGLREGGAPVASAVGSRACVAVKAAMSSSERIRERRSSTLPTT